MSARLMVNAFDPGKKTDLDPETQRMIERRRRALGPSYKLFYDHPVHAVRAEGVWLYDPDGAAYLDAYNNVPSVGHCHPHVVAAIARQSAILNTHTRYLHDPVLTYAERLLSTFPEETSNVMFCCTGSEAADLALQVARSYTGGTGFIVTRNAYHGNTSAVSQISPSLGTLVPLGDHVRAVAPPDRYRSRTGDVEGEFVAGIERAIANMTRHGIRLAGLIVDTIFSSDGVYADPPGFLAGAVDVVRAAGGLFIADEVQPGFGRMGTHMWGFQRHGVVPDMVILGKPMGNGMPIAGVVAKPMVLQPFAARSRYFNTFGGNPVSCAAALAVLEVLEHERLMDNALSVGTYLRDELQRLSCTFPAIADVRGAGLFIGVELVEDPETKAPASELASRIVNALREKRILISASGAEGHVLKIRPPLPFSRENANQVVAGLKEAIAEQST